MVMEGVVGLDAALKLRVNVAKSAVAPVWDRSFLGFSFWRAPGQIVKCRVAPKALTKNEGAHPRHHDAARRLKPPVCRGRAPALSRGVECVLTAPQRRTTLCPPARSAVSTAAMVRSSSSAMALSTSSSNTFASTGADRPVLPINKRMALHREVLDEFSLAFNSLRRRYASTTCNPCELVRRGPAWRCVLNPGSGASPILWTPLRHVAEANITFRLDVLSCFALPPGWPSHSNMRLGSSQGSGHVTRAPPSR